MRTRVIQARYSRGLYVMRCYATRVRINSPRGDSRDVNCVFCISIARARARTRYSCLETLPKYTRARVMVSHDLSGRRA